ncbi:MAG: adhesin, partial [Veillonella sp.]|nr:adhesin [Veillonella sp.]
VPASDVIVSIQDAAGNTTGGNSIVNNVGSAIKNQTGADYLTKLDTANGLTPNAAVNVSDLKSTADALRANELHIAPTAVKAGSTEAKGGVVSGTENVYKYDAATKKVTLTYNDGKGTAVSDTKAVIDFSDLNIPAAGNNYSFKTNATGNIENNGTATETEVPSGKTVNFGAGKNLTIKQEIGADNNQTYTYALNKDLTNLDKVVVNGKDGKDGEDGVSITGPTGAAGTDGNNGKVGITGKDGKDAVSISGKDGVGHIGLTGPAGKDGKNVTADITVKEGKAGVDGKDGVDGITRIFYNDKDGNEHQVATHDDGMKFAGDDGQTDDTKVLKKHLNNVVDIIGGADKTKLTSTDNIGVNNVNGKLKVQLAKNVDLDADGSLTTGATKVDNNGVTITAPAGGTTTDVKLTKDGLDNGGNKIVNVKAGENDTDAVNLKQLKDKVTTVKSSDSSIKVVDENDPTSATYDAAKGHQYDITINNQTVVEKAQTPVVYTNKDGDKLYKIVDPATGNVTFNTKEDGTGTTVQPADVIA